MKDKTTALILSVLTGGLGIDRFYLGYIGMGILKLLTGGCFGVLYIIDIINIATGKLGPADGSPYNSGTTPTPSAPSAPSAPPKQANTTEDLKKHFKELLDQGVITEDEFQEIILNL